MSFRPCLPTIKASGNSQEELNRVNCGSNQHATLAQVPAERSPTQKAISSEKYVSCILSAILKELNISVIESNIVLNRQVMTDENWKMERFCRNYESRNLRKLFRTIVVQSEMRYFNLHKTFFRRL